MNIVHLTQYSLHFVMKTILPFYFLPTSTVCQAIMFYIGQDTVFVCILFHYVHSYLVLKDMQVKFTVFVCILFHYVHSYLVLNYLQYRTCIILIDLAYSLFEHVETYVLRCLVTFIGMIGDPEYICTHRNMNREHISWYPNYYSMLFPNIHVFSHQYKYRETWIRKRVNLMENSFIF